MKQFRILIAAAMALSLTACSGGNEPAASSGSAKETPETAPETTPETASEGHLVKGSDFEVEFTTGSFTSMFGTTSDNAAVINLVNHSDVAVYSPELTFKLNEEGITALLQDSEYSMMNSQLNNVVSMDVCAKPGETTEIGNMITQIGADTAAGWDTLALTTEMMKDAELIEVGFYAIVDDQVKYVRVKAADDTAIDLNKEPSSDRYVVNEIPEKLKDGVLEPEGASPYFCSNGDDGTIELTAYNMSESAIDSYLDRLSEKYSAFKELMSEDNLGYGMGNVAEGNYSYTVRWDKKNGVIKIYQ